MVAEVERPPARPRLRWWREVVYVLVFYIVYSAVRNKGLAADPEPEAFANARTVIRLERLVGLYREESIQQAFLGHRWFIRLCNIYYGSLHFIVTAGALVWTFLRRRDRYPLWRNTLAFTTALALVGFAFFPLMPPRLLPPSYGYVDTLAEFGGLWSFDSGTMKSISNQYAAMPSLHFGWSLWSALVLWPVAGARRWAKALLAGYPAATLFATVVTANHFWLDALGGATVLGAGYAGARWVAGRRRSSGPEAPPGQDDGPG
ncbi:MAG: phosphatase PAP2 family protein [Actinobacteria bacterium]|nr:phosphatase PAP2 family protein [Actinomycetota bacterium]MBW3650468.1 phosphatase PAP2 family protein [Actinomycetota bacterium]